MGKTFDSLGQSVYAELAQLTPNLINPPSTSNSTPSPVSLPPKKLETYHSVYFDKLGRVPQTPVYLLDKLEIGGMVVGPAMIIDDTQTIVVVPGAKAVLTSRHLVITL